MPNIFGLRSCPNERSVAINRLDFVSSRARLGVRQNELDARLDGGRSIKGKQKGRSAQWQAPRPCNSEQTDPATTYVCRLSGERDRAHVVCQKPANRTEGGTSVRAVVQCVGGDQWMTFLEVTNKKDFLKKGLVHKHLVGLQKGHPNNSQVVGAQLLT